MSKDAEEELCQEWMKEQREIAATECPEILQDILKLQRLHLEYRYGAELEEDE